VKLTIQLHPVPRSRTHGAIPPLLNTPLWRGVQLKQRNNMNYEAPHYVVFFSLLPPPPRKEEEEEISVA